jgi:hypothetical protein
MIFINKNSIVPGANAALYSRKLMHHAYLELEKFKINDPYFHHTVDPVSILQKSYEESMLEAKKEVDDRPLFSLHT